MCCEDKISQIDLVNLINNSPKVLYGYRIQIKRKFFVRRTRVHTEGNERFKTKKYENFNDNGYEIKTLHANLSSRNTYQGESYRFEK